MRNAFDDVTECRYCGSLLIASPWAPIWLVDDGKQPPYGYHAACSDIRIDNWDIDTIAHLGEE